MDSRSASSEKRARIDLQDLKEQREGEAHIFFKSKIVRAKMFFANPAPAERIRINHFLKVEPPIGRVLLDLESRLEQFDRIIKEDQLIFVMPQDEAEEIRIIAKVMNENKDVNAIERGVSALLAFHNRNALPEGVEIPVVEEVAEDTSRINIFGKILLGENVKKLVGPADLERFSSPLINKAYIKDKVELLERVLGRSGSQANTIANEIVKDMLSATDYPPNVEGIFLEVEQVTTAAKELADYVASLQKTNQEDGVL